MATVILRPNGPGDYTELDPYPALTLNWDNVNEDPSDEAGTFNYRWEDTDAKDGYALEALGVSGVIINSVTVHFRYQVNVASGVVASQFTPGLRLIPPDVYGTMIEYNVATWVTSNEVISRPGGGDWAEADIADLQVLFKMRGDNSGLQGIARLTQIYVVVDYTPVAGRSFGYIIG